MCKFTALFIQEFYILKVTMVGIIRKRRAQEKKVTKVMAGVGCRNSFAFLCFQI